MAYKQVGWKDYPDKTTPLNTQNLKHMEDGIVANDAAIGDISKISGIDDGTLAGAVAAQNDALATKVNNNDTRLSDARRPTSHIHDDRYYTESEINDIIANINNRLIDNNTDANYDFLMRRNTSVHGRANNAYYFLQSGIYETSPNTNGATDYGVILVIRPYSSWVFQIWFTTSGHIYVRKNINNEGFTNWETIK